MALALLTAALPLPPVAAADRATTAGTQNGAKTPDARQLTIANGQLAWLLDWGDGHLRSGRFENKLSGRGWALGDVEELALTFSAAIDRVQEPLARVADFQVRAARLVDPVHAVVELRTPAMAIEVTAHYQLDGPTRRKWIEVTNRTGKEVLLLDVQLDDFTTEGGASGGGRGQPLFVGGEWFAAIEHPSGVNQADKNRVRMIHHPGRRLKPDETFRSHVALVSVAKPGQALEHFIGYIQSRSLRKPRATAVYTPFGINSQWGGCPTLDEEQTLDVLNVLEKWQKKGVRFDYFTLDVGWADLGSDLTRFNPTCYPNGPGRVVQRVNALGMKFGLWFATSWAAESCWDYPPALAGQPPVSLGYRLGYPDKAAEGRMFCFGAEPYYSTLRNAVLHHIRENHVRLLKFDGGNYACDCTGHGHLPGKYSVEFMHERLIDLANAARAAAPDVVVMWYWGLNSPFWALYGDMIFESGLTMEGSATSAFPALYYRDSVTIAQDQNAQFARTIPPLVKDSLGVWLADTRWGNYMGKDRWREGLSWTSAAAASSSQTYGATSISSPAPTWTSSPGSARRPGTMNHCSCTGGRSSAIR
jgi:hypothetical protein